MGADTRDPVDAAPSPAIRGGGVLDFAAKAFIAGAVIVGAVGFILPDTEELKARVKKEIRRPETRIRLIGLLTSNPQVHWRISGIRENDGDLSGACSSHSDGHDQRDGSSS